MKSLTVRLVVSHLLLALIALGGAGILLQARLAPAFASFDEAETRDQLDGAARAVGLATILRGVTDPMQLTGEIRRFSPAITVRQVTEIPEYPELLPLNRYAFGDIRSADGSQFFSGDNARSVAIATIYRARTEPRLRLVSRHHVSQPTAHFAVTWENLPQSEQSDALRRALFLALLLALLGAAVTAVWFGRTLSRPLRDMATAAERLAGGEFDAPLPESGTGEIGQLSEAFREMAARLATDFERLKGDREKLKQLAAEVAHELKTPIASLRTYHELLLDGEQENPANRQVLLERGAAQVRRLEYLTHFLVDMARLESHAAPLNLAESNLAVLVREAVAGAGPEAGRKGVSLRCWTPEWPVPVLADRQRIGQALDNLLQNALRWTGEGGEVRVTLDRMGQWATVTVEDTGPGIAPEMVDRLFTPFARGQGSAGLGLGLAIVKAVAESHGGSVTGGNRPDRGAIFRLKLPLQGERQGE